MGKRWVKKKKKEYYYKWAKASGYRSRAAFKLKQLNKKFKIFKKGDMVLELGAAPGGWTQVIMTAVGGDGLVVGVDLERMEPFKEPNVVTLKGDFTEEETQEKIKEHSPKYDVIISDASPNISGVWDIDHFRSVDLCRKGLGVARELLETGGNFLVKVFEGSEIEDFVREVKEEFSYVKLSKPKASRGQSAETYLLARGFLSSPVKKGQEVELDIVATGSQGDGLGYYRDFKIFVPGTEEGQKVRVKIERVHTRFAEAKLKG